MRPMQLARCYYNQDMEAKLIMNMFISQSICDELILKKTCISPEILKPGHERNLMKISTK